MIWIKFITYEWSENVPTSRRSWTYPHDDLVQRATQAEEGAGAETQELLQSLPLRRQEDRLLHLQPTLQVRYQAGTPGLQPALRTPWGPTRTATEIDGCIQGLLSIRAKRATE